MPDVLGPDAAPACQRGLIRTAAHPSAPVPWQGPLSPAGREQGPRRELPRGGHRSDPLCPQPERAGDFLAHAAHEHRPLHPESSPGHGVCSSRRLGQRPARPGPACGAWHRAGFSRGQETHHGRPSPGLRNPDSLQARPRLGPHLGGPSPWRRRPVPPHLPEEPGEPVSALRDSWKQGPS